MSKLRSILSSAKAASSKLVSLSSGVRNKGLPKETVSKVVSKYEAFTGVNELRQLHKNVVAAQEKFVSMQEKRREAGDTLMEKQRKLKSIHEEMQTISKGDPNYLKLITEEHKLIVEEEMLRKEFINVEKQEREYFSEMTAAVKLSHETERFFAEKNKYLYLVASLAGTIIGVLGSTINNRIKMAEFKELVMEEMSGSKIWSLNFNDGPIQRKMKDVESRVTAISTNQKIILDYIINIEKMIESRFSTTNQLVQSMSKQNNKNTVVLPTPQYDIETIKSVSFYVSLGLLVAYFVGKIVSG